MTMWTFSAPMSAMRTVSLEEEAPPILLASAPDAEASGEPALPALERSEGSEAAGATVRDGPPVPGALPPSDDEMARRSRMIGALMREAAALGAMLDASLRYCRSQTGIEGLAIERVLITGGGSRLQGLTEFLARRMSLPVEQMGPPTALATAGPEAESMRASPELFSVAAGLALSRIEPGAMRFHLLPEVVVKSRSFWSRTIYVYYSAAVLAALLFLLVYGSIRNYLIQRDNRDSLVLAVKQARTERSKLDGLRAYNERLRAELRDLEKRAFSGRDMLRSLGEMRGKIPREIWLTQITNTPPEVLKAAQEEERRERGTTLVRNLPTHIGEFAAQRELYVRGYTIAVSETKAVENIAQYFRSLQNLFVYKLAGGEPLQSRQMYLKRLTKESPPSMPSAGGQVYEEFIFLLRVAEDVPARGGRRR